MKTVDLNQILKMLDGAERVDVQCDGHSFPTTWFTGSLREENGDILIDSDYTSRCVVSLGDIDGALVDEEGYVVLRDGRKVVIFGKQAPGEPKEETASDFNIVIGDGYCQYSYALTARNDLSINAIAQALARAVGGQMSAGKLVEVQMVELLDASNPN